MTATKKLKVVFRGPALSISGYGTHTRQLIRWLLARPDIELKVRAVQWGITPWYVNRSALGGLVGEIMSRCDDDKGPFDISFQVQLPNEWDPKLATKNVGITAGVETTVCNPSWVGCVNSMDHVIVPSTFVKSTFMRSGTLRDDGARVTVVPESFIDAAGQSDIGVSRLELPAQFNFLSIGQMTGTDPGSDRKNLFNMLKWFCETFEGREDVGLVLKTNSGRDTRIDRKYVSDLLQHVIKASRKSQFPRIHLLHGLMDDIEIAQLYRHPRIKAFMTLTRGEGFCLPMLEAAASGLPVIAPNWSGYLDFMGLGRFVKLDFELQSLPKQRLDAKIFVEGAKWAEVNEVDVKKKLVRFVERPGIPMEWAHELRQRVRDAFSHQALVSHYDAVLESVRQ